MKNIIVVITLLTSLLLVNCEHNSKNKNTIEAKHEIINENIDSVNNYDSEVTLDKELVDSIKRLIHLFEVRDIEGISNKISYPLERYYPIPPIKDKKEFIRRFDEVFDKAFIDRIVNSEMSQWSEVGYRGTMFDSGDLWMGNSDGVITVVNYESNLENQMRKELISKEKNNLHESIQDFEYSFHKIKTESYLIRIDLLKSDEYRFSYWETGEKESSKPLLVLTCTGYEAHGSGGDYSLTFVDEEYSYEVFRHIGRGSDTPEVSFTIKKGDEELLYERGELVK